MPGIASDRSPAIQTSQIGSIGSEPVQPAALNDLMGAFREGFITVNDIQRRLRQDKSEQSSVDTQLQEDAIRRRRLAEGETLAPGNLEIARKKQQLTGSQLDTELVQEPARRKVAEKQTTDIQDLLNPQTRGEALNRLEQEKLEEAYVQAVGPLPESVEAAAPEPTEDFQTWFDRTQGPKLEQDIVEFSNLPGPKPSPTEVHNYANTLTAAGIQGDDFDNKVLEFSSGQKKDPNQIKQFADQRLRELQASQTIRDQFDNETSSKEGKVKTIPRGTPEFYDQIRKDLKTAIRKQGTEAAVLKATPGILEAKAKAEAEAPAKQAKAAADGLAAALQARDKSETLKRFAPQAEAFQKVDQIKNSGRPPTNADDISLMYEYVKLLDPSSAVREGEAKLAASTVPAIRAIYNKGRSIFVDQNKLFDAGTRQSLYSAMDDLKRGAEANIRPELARLAQVAITSGAPLNQVFTTPELDLLNGAKQLTPAAGAQPVNSAPPPPNVGARRVVQNGVVFEWNGTTYVPAGH